MIRVLLATGLWFCLVTIGHSQEQVPFFLDKKDSITYFSIEFELRNLFKSNLETNRLRIDSLLMEQLPLRERIAGYRYSYKPKFKSLQQIQPDDYKTITELSLSSVKKIPSQVYQLSSLKTLELIETQFRRIPKKLKKNKNLQTLEIRNPKISKPLKFGRNTFFKQLSISSTRLPKTFSTLPSLEKLDLSKNNLTQAPRLKGLRNLKDLNLKNNQLVSLEDLKFDETPKLQNLELQYNKIEAIPAPLGKLKALKKLMLNYNQVRSMDESLANCKSLEQIGLYQNNLTAIPGCLYELNSLKEIDLYYNQIEKVDPKISNWKNLEILYLSNNRIFSLPESLGELASLQELYLSNNRLTTLPISIDRLAKLRVLRVNENRLVGPFESLLKLNNIENIDVSSNSISALDLSLLDKPSLKIVILKGNPWDEETKTKLLNRVEELRAKGVIVHLDGQPLIGGPDSK